MLQRLRVPANVDDVREVARRTMPRMVFDYVDGGSGSELTMRANRDAFDEIVFRPRMAVPVLDPDLRTTVLGLPLSMPLLLSPCGGLRAMHPDGECGVARAAQRAGIAFTLSTAAGTALEEVAAAANGPLLFQLYFLGGRAGAERMIDRAEAAGCRALVVTVDTNVAGTRARDVRNGMTAGPYVNARNIVRFAPHVARRPGWLYRFVRDGMNVELANTKALCADGGPMDPTDAHLAMFAEPPTWSDLGWIRRRWQGPLAVKGILTAEDARRAADLGVDAVIVSNHGGRQLDGAPATMRALPGVVDAVGDRVEVLIDSGARRGSDVVRALAIGAKAVMFGRAYVYGLGAAGEAGVDTVLRLLRDDLRNTMQLLGCDSVRTLDRTWLAT